MVYLRLDGVGNSLLHRDGMPLVRAGRSASANRRTRPSRNPTLEVQTALKPTNDRGRDDGRGWRCHIQQEYHQRRITMITKEIFQVSGYWTAVARQYARTFKTATQPSRCEASCFQVSGGRLQGPPGSWEPQAKKKGV